MPSVSIVAEVSGSVGFRELGVVDDVYPTLIEVGAEALVEPAFRKRCVIVAFLHSYPGVEPLTFTSRRPP